MRKKEIVSFQDKYIKNVYKINKNKIISIKINFHKCEESEKTV